MRRLQGITIYRMLHVTLVVPNIDSKFKRMGFLEAGSRKGRIAKNNFPQKSSFMDFGVYLFRFLEALGTYFSGFRCA